MTSFNRPAYSLPVKRIEELFALLAMVPAGRSELTRFLKEFHMGRVRIEGYALDLLERLKEATGPDQPIGACFMNDGDQGVIYLDMTAQAGVLAPFLLHEIVHSLDIRLWAKPGSPEQKALNESSALLDAETRAFNTQRRFIEEMKAADPSYGQFLTQRYPKARILLDRLSREDIAELYGFDEAA